MVCITIIDICITIYHQKYTSTKNSWSVVQGKSWCALYLPRIWSLADFQTNLDFLTSPHIGTKWVGVRQRFQWLGIQWYLPLASWRGAEDGKVKKVFLLPNWWSFCVEFVGNSNFKRKSALSCNTFVTQRRSPDMGQNISAWNEDDREIKTEECIHRNKKHSL